MPHWATGMQSLVNGWVKVNIRHGGFPQGNGEGHHKRESDVQVVIDSTRAPDGDVLRNDVPKTKDRDVVSHNTTSTEPTTVDPETLAIRKFHSKHGRRRLHRTISHSDLLREMAEDAKKLSDSGRSRLRDSIKHESDGLDHSRRPVAGLFGSQVPDEKPKQSRQQCPVTTGKYLNEAMFVQQLERTKAHQRSLSSGGGSESDHSSYKRTARPPDSSAPLHEQYHRHRAVGIMDVHGTGYDPEAAERFQVSNARSETVGRKPLVSHTGVAHDAIAYCGLKGDLKTTCPGCSEMERRLLSAYEDIRYLHDVALRSEFNRDFPKPKTNILSASHHELTTLADASKRLTEVTARHRRQIEQMTRETSRKLHDMHFKHSKISMFCKELNDESSIRKQEAVKLEAEVCELKKERDSLATEVQRLRSEVSLLELEKQEHRLLRETLTHYENGVLGRADEAILERDKMIADLSVRLERTIETLQIEREQQRQRRKIIFPVEKSMHPPEILSSKNMATLEEELRIAKEAAKSSQKLLEATIKEATQRDDALKARCEDLERRLKKEEPPENVTRGNG